VGFDRISWVTFAYGTSGPGSRPGQLRQSGEEPSAGLRQLLEDGEVIVTRERRVPAFEAVPLPRGLILLGLSNQLGPLTETDGDDEPPRP
jgi:hypothetical protein